MFRNRVCNPTNIYPITTNSNTKLPKHSFILNVKVYKKNILLITLMDVFSKSIKQKLHYF
jgi:hypothetical protein